MGSVQQRVAQFSAAEVAEAAVAFAELQVVSPQFLEPLVSRPGRPLPDLFLSLGICWVAEVELRKYKRTQYGFTFFYDRGMGVPVWYGHGCVGVHVSLCPHDVVWVGMGVLCGRAWGLPLLSPRRPTPVAACRRAMEHRVLEALTVEQTVALVAALSRLPGPREQRQPLEQRLRRLPAGEVAGLAVAVAERGVQDAGLEAALRGVVAALASREGRADRMEWVRGVPLSLMLFQQTHAYTNAHTHTHLRAHTPHHTQTQT